MGMLDGRVAMVTGGGRGVGAEVAKMFAANGAKVLINDPGVGGGGEVHGLWCSQKEDVIVIWNVHIRGHHHHDLIRRQGLAAETAQAVFQQ